MLTLVFKIVSGIMNDEWKGDHYGYRALFR